MLNISNAYITVEIIGFPGLDHIGRVRQAGPLVQMGSVVEVIDLDLAFLGMLKTQHVHRQVEPGLGLVEVLLVDVVTRDLGDMSSQHDQRVILHTASTDMMAALLAETSLVLVLKI